MIDFTDPHFVADPYPALKVLRDAPGPVWHEGCLLYTSPSPRDS